MLMGAVKNSTVSELMLNFMNLFGFQIDYDLKEENVKVLLNQEVDVDKPGGAQFYCVHCA